MNVEIIIFLAVWLISTEFIFFKFIRKNGEPFMPNKALSTMVGLLSSMLLFGAPWMMAKMSYVVDAEPLGNIVYVWFYGLIAAVALFFLINYKIDKCMKRKEASGKRRKKG